MEFSRYAVYYIPDGPLAEFGAAWLGWGPRIGEKINTLNFLTLKNLQEDNYRQCFRAPCLHTFVFVEQQRTNTIFKANEHEHQFHEQQKSNANKRHSLYKMIFAL